MSDWLSHLLPKKLRVQFKLDLSKMRRCSLFSFIYAPQSQTTITIDGNSLTANIAHLSAAEKKGLLGLARALLPATGSIVASDTRDEILLLKKEEAAPQVRDTIVYFRDIIPSSDIPVLRACMHLKNEHEADKPVQLLKQQIIQAWGERGRNIANLCSAGYFETWFKPFFDELKKTETTIGKAKERFLVVYEEIVTKQPWTVFVSRPMSVSQLEDAIISRLAYGSVFVYVHALGTTNIDKTIKVADKLTSNSKALDIRQTVVREAGRIRIKFETTP